MGETQDLFFHDEGLQNGREYYYIVTAVGPGASCLGPASTCLTTAPAPGPKIKISQGRSHSLTGDEDICIDNCERTEVLIEIENLGNSPVNLQVKDIQLLGPAGASLSFLAFDNTFFTLNPCESTTRSFQFEVKGLQFGDDLKFDVCVLDNGNTSCQNNIAINNTLSFGRTQCNLQPFASRTWNFNNSREDWMTTQGTFDRTMDNGEFFIQSSSFLDDQCDQIRSPRLILSPTSTLSLSSNYDIEDQSGGNWYDRANVGLTAEDGGPTGARNTIQPDGGRLYDTDNSNFGGCNATEAGWAGSNPTWATSTWSSAALNAPILAGQVLQIDVIYSTDGALANRGFAFDDVTLTGFELLVPDTLSGPIFVDGFESGDTSAWSSANP